MHSFINHKERQMQELFIKNVKIETPPELQIKQDIETKTMPSGITESKEHLEESIFKR